MPRSLLDKHGVAGTGSLVLALLLMWHIPGIGVDAASAQDLGGSDGHIQQVSPSAESDGVEASATVEFQIGEAAGELFPCTVLTSEAPSCGPVPSDLSPDATGGNSASITQVGSGQTATVVQRGGGHSLGAAMSGTGNDLSVTQVGSGNVIRGENGGPLNIGGTGNSLTIEQTGRDLTYIDRFDFRGNGLSGTVVQEGVNLQMLQTGPVGRDFQVTQRGQNYRVTVETSRGLVTPTPLNP